MSSLGMNVDPLNPDNAPDLTLLLAMHVRWVRLVSRNEPEVVGYRNAAQAAGIAVCGVITEQSGGYVLPSCDLYQIGNEPDVTGTADTRNPQGYVDYWNLYYDTYFRDGAALAGVPVIGAGLGAGQPAYWSQVNLAGGLRGAAGFAAHPYAKTASQAHSLLLAYQHLTPNLGLWVTEWNRPAAEIGVFSAMLQTLPVVGMAWFCWSRAVAIDQRLYPLDYHLQRTVGAFA